MRTEENLRDAVRKFLEDWPCPACFGHELCCSRPRLKQALAEAGDEPEMKQLLQWLEKERSFAVGLQTGESPGLQIAAMNQVVVWDSIKAKIESLGYTLKEQEDKT